MRIRAFAACVVAAFCVAFAVVPALAQSSDEYEIFQLVNRERARVRKPALMWNDRVANVARSFSQQMAREKFFSHHDRSGRSVEHRAAGLGGWTRIGENLFMAHGLEHLAGFSVQGWLKSSSHRKNMLDASWTETGIGVYRTRDRRVYVTQVFLRR